MEKFSLLTDTVIVISFFIVAFSVTRGVFQYLAEKKIVKRRAARKIVKESIIIKNLREKRERQQQFELRSNKAQVPVH